MTQLHHVCIDQPCRGTVCKFSLILIWLFVSIGGQLTVYGQQPTDRSQSLDLSRIRELDRLTDVTLAREIARDELPTPTAEYEFVDVDVVEIVDWIEYFGIELPFALDGRVSGWFYGLRQGGIFDLGQYRFEGEISSDLLTIEDWNVQNGRVRFGYENGIWYLYDLSGQIVEASKTETGSWLSLGIANLAAEYPLNDGPIRVACDITAADIETLAKKINIELPIVIESGDLRFRAENTTREIAAPADWSAFAKLQRSRFKYEGIEFTSSSVELIYDRGVWELSEFDIETRGGFAKLRGYGSLAVGKQNAVVSKDGGLNYQVELDSSTIDLAKLLAGTEFEALADGLAGQVSVDGELSGHGDEFLIDLRIESDDLAYQNVQLESLQSQFISNPRAAIIHLPRISLEDGGNVSAQIRWLSLLELTEIPSSAEIQVEDLPIDLLRTFGLNDSRGFASGEINMETAGSPESRMIRGELLVPALEVAGVKLGQAKFTVPKQSISSERASTLTADLSLEQNDGLALGSLQLNIQDFEARAAQAKLEFNRYQFDDSNLKFMLNGSGFLAGNIDSGTNAALQWPQSGELSLAGSRIERGGRSIDVRFCEFDVTKEEFRFDKIELANGPSKIVGSAMVSRELGAAHRAELMMFDFDVERLKQEFDFYPELPATGLIEASLKVSAESSVSWLQDLQTIELWSGKFDASVKDFRFAGTSPSNVQLNGFLLNGEATGDLTGDFFGSQTIAKFRCDAKRFLGSSSPAPQQPPAAQLSVRMIGAQAEDVATLVYLPRDAQKFGGRISLGIDFAASSQRVESARVEIFAPRVTWSRLNLTEQLDIVGQYSAGDNLIRIQDVTGRFGGGRLRVQGTIPINLVDTELARGGQLRFSIDRVSLAAVTTLIAPEYANEITGFVSYRGRATFNRGIQLSGTTLLDDGLVFGLPIQHITGRTQVDLSKFGEIEKISSENFHGTAFDGRVDGSVTLRGGTHYELDAFAKLGNGRVDQLSRALGFENVLGRGRFDGQIQLSSKKIDRIDELTGSIRMSFESGSSEAIPVVGELARLGPFSSLASTTIESGRLEATIGVGRVRINDLYLGSPAFWLAATGTAGLVGGRLDLQGVVQTGGGLENQLADTAVRGLASKAVPALAIANALNEAIRNRSLFFEVDGTTQRPIVRPKPAQTIGKALLQEFGRQAVRSFLGTGQTLSAGP